MDIATKQDAARAHVVIVGAGFAGLHCARHLASNQGVRVKPAVAWVIRSIRVRVAVAIRITYREPW